jgi:hypothetical protein
MKSLYTFGCAVIFAVTTSHAATIAVGQGFGTNVGVVAKTQFANGGVALSGGGYYLAVGTFTVEPVITTEFSSLLAAVGSFNIFQTLTSPTAVGATQGSIVGAFTSTGGADPSIFNTKPIYMVIGNGANAASSTEWGIFRTPVAFPANVTLSGSTPVTLSSVSSFTALANAGTAIDIDGGKDQFQLVGIPEPSAALLGALGALGLLRRRRI